MENKYCTIIKRGYSAGVHGCSNEFFTLIYTSENGLKSIHFKGMYGVEERIRKEIEAKGYEFNYTGGYYGQLKGDERTWKYWLYENQAIEEIEKNL